MIYRIDVSPRRTGGANAAEDTFEDAAGAAVRKQLQSQGLDVGPTRSARVFFLDSA